MRSLRTLLALALAVSISGTLLADIESPDNPGKPLPGTATPSGITISCVDDVTNTDFTCGNGQGPYFTEFQNYDEPDLFEYFRVTCTPGENVRIEIWRVTDDMDPGAFACEGDFCGMGNDGWGAFSCPDGVNELANSDDNNGIPCGVGGPYADPRLDFVCPAGGVATMAVFDVLGAGPTPEFEIHSSGVLGPVPTMRPVALAALTLLLLMAAALVFGRL